MDKTVARSASCAGLGGMIGGAIGQMFEGAVLTLPGINIVLAPVVATRVIPLSCSAVGSLIGAGVGMVSGAVETARERKRDSEDRRDCR